MIGRRPYLSLRLPTTGANANWVRENAKSNHPLRLEAVPVLTPSIWAINAGITGIIIPYPITSINRVTKMNQMVAFRGADMWDPWARIWARKSKRFTRRKLARVDLHLSCHLIIHGKLSTFAKLFWKGVCRISGKTSPKSSISLY